MPATAPNPRDERTTSQLLRQWEKLETVKRQMLKAGLLNGDASPNDTLNCIRDQIPPDMFE